MALFVNIMDSTFPQNPSSVYPLFYKAIMRIFEIVKLFGDDHTKFWAFLQDVGCITDNASEKDRQQLPYPSARLGDEPRFRVYGRVCLMRLAAKFPQRLLQQFKRIQLVSWLPPIDGAYQNAVMDCTTVDDITFTPSNNDKIDTFLKQYQESKESKGQGVAPASAASSPTPDTTRAMGLHQFLQQLRALSEY